MLRLVGIGGRKNTSPNAAALEFCFPEPQEMPLSLGYFV
jgi:hypothetical protein